MSSQAAAPFEAPVLRDRIASLGIPLGTPLHLLQETASTNEQAMRLAQKGAPHGTLVLAESQTAGRGRLGRQWLATPYQNLTLSLILRPHFPLERLACIALALGLAVANAASQFVAPSAVGVKWPNDVQVRGKKLCGILIEASTQGNSELNLVAGIGLNVLQTEFPPELRPIATSLALECDQPPDRTSVLLALLQSIHYRVGQFEAAGLSLMLDELRAQDVTVGRTVKIGDQLGVADGLEADGKLRVRDESGRIRLVQSGDVELINPNRYL